MWKICLMIFFSPIVNLAHALLIDIVFLKLNPSLPRTTLTQRAQSDGLRLSLILYKKQDTELFPD